MFLKSYLTHLGYYKERSECKIFGEDDTNELVFYSKCRKCEFGVVTNYQDCLFDAFLWASANGRLEVLQMMYEAGYKDFHHENDNALFWACRQGHLKIVKWLCSTIHYDFSL